MENVDGLEVKEDVLYDENMTLQKVPVGTTYDKKELLDKTLVIEITGFGLNRFGKKELHCIIDDEKTRLPVSNKNQNELIEKLGTQLSDWIGEKVTVKGSLWEGEIDGQQRTGVELTFF